MHLNRVEIELDTHSAVIHEDIQDFIFKIYDTDIKLKLVDLTMNLLGLPKVFFTQPSIENFPYYTFIKNGLLSESSEQGFKVYEKVSQSPHLWNYAIVFSNLTEQYLQVAQVSKFEYARRVLSELVRIYPQSKVLEYSRFVVELVKSKSPVYQTLESERVIQQGKADTEFKKILKGQSAVLAALDCLY